MQRGSKGNGANSPTRIADLRASLRVTEPHLEARLSRPPKQRKAVIRENEEDRALKAEKQAMVQHTTSLLNGGKPAGKNYKRPSERNERKGSLTGFVFQLLLVLCIAGGVAYALDPTIVPDEWKTKAHDFISKYVEI
jgi:hypothetical protein